METLIYDEIIGTLLMNVLAEEKRCGKVVLKNFHVENPAHRLYFEAAVIANAISRAPIYMDMSLWEYLRFKYQKRHKKMRKTIRRYTTPVAAEMKVEATKIGTILDHVASYYNIDNEVYGDILKEYYEVTDEN